MGVLVSFLWYLKFVYGFVLGEEIFDDACEDVFVVWGVVGGGWFLEEDVLGGAVLLG